MFRKKSNVVEEKNDFKNKFKGLVNKFCQLFKYKEIKKVKDTTSQYHDYLTEFKVKSVGITNCENNVVVDKNNNEYVILKFEFLRANGVNTTQTNANLDALRLIENEVNNKAKDIYLREAKDELATNIKYYKYLLEREERVNYRESLEERLMQMEYLNKIEQKTHYGLIENRNIKDVIMSYSRVFDVHVLDKKEIVQFLKKLNNDWGTQI